jgi:hypothetical protein
MDEQIIRAKWVMDGAGSLSEAAKLLREFADSLERMESEGWQLDDPIEDDYGYLYRDAS